MSIWAALVFMLLIKENRIWRAWMVLVPVLIIHLLLFLLKLGLSFLPPEVISMFIRYFSSLALGLAILWLLSYKLDSLSRSVTFLLAACIMAAAGILANISYADLNFSGEMLASLILYGLGALSILTGMGVSHYFCRNNYSPPRFRIRLPLWILLATVCIGFLSFFIISSIFEPGELNSGILLGVLAFCSVMGLILYLILLPFVILTFGNSVYLARFNSVFRIEDTESQQTGINLCEER